jgi:hypothetical protein
MKARKGDLILVGTVHASYVIGQGRQETLSYDFGVVASATRAGLAKSWRQLGYGDELLGGAVVPVPAQSFSDKRVYVVSASAIDVDAVLRAAKAHHWPGHPGQPRGFDTLSGARECARPFVIEAAS